MAGPAGPPTTALNRLEPLTPVSWLPVNYTHHRHFLFVTQPKSWYSFYCPMEGRRLSWPSWHWLASLPAHKWDCRGVTTCAQPWRSYTGCPSCTESNSYWHGWRSQSTHVAAQTTSPIQCRRATVIRHGLVSARRPALTILFHGQERNLAREPSLWPTQSYWTVY